MQGHIDDLGSEGGIVGFEIKKRVFHRRNLMIIDLRLIGTQSRRSLVADEMNLVPFMGQCYAQFGGDHSAAPVGGVTNNAHIELFSCHTAD